jgi:ribose/xylose/arabinose/galactoside ABC-type transport system permease subunit
MTTSSGTMRQRILGLTSRHRWIGPLLALVLVFALFVILRPDTFARPINLMTMARQTAVVGIAATGMTLVIVLGGIDLSVGSAVALSTVLIAMLLKSGLGPMPAVGLAIVFVAATGLANGALVVGLEITPFIVTLGTMSILRGAAKGLAHEQTIEVDAHGIDNLVLPSRGLFSMPLAVWLLGIIAVATSFLLRSTTFGRHIFAIGSNERTARLCGVRVARVKVITYLIAAALAGLAGVVEFGTLTLGDPTDSVGLELDVIASCVIGGGSLAGGEGSILGTMIGALLMTVIKTGCTHLGLSNWVQQIVTGSIIIAAAGFDRLQQKRSAT